MKIKTHLSKAVFLLVMCAGITLSSCDSASVELIEKEPIEEESAGNNDSSNGDQQPDDNNQQQTKGPITLTLGEVTYATASFNAHVDVDLMEGYQEVGFIFSSNKEIDVDSEHSTKVRITKENYSHVFQNLRYNTVYYYSVYLVKNNIYQYGETQTFTTKDVDVNIENVSIEATSVVFTGKASSNLQSSNIKVGIQYGDSEAAMIKEEIHPDENGNYNLEINGLCHGVKYWYNTYICQNDEYVYGEIKNFITTIVSVSAIHDENSITATSVTINGEVNGWPHGDSSFECGLIYSTEEGDVENGKGLRKVIELKEDNTLTIDLLDLQHGTKYFYRPYINQNESFSYGATYDFVTTKVSVDLTVDNSSITGSSAQIKGKVNGLSGNESLFEVGILYSSDKSKVDNGGGAQLVGGVSEDQSVIFDLNNLDSETVYYYRAYIKQSDVYSYENVNTFTTPNPYSATSDLNLASASDLSSSGAANSYIVSSTGLYKFRTIKGNSSESIANVASCKILWESFGTDVQPERFDLINGICCKDGYIAFQTASSFKEGNASIAAVDASGKVLWSWHLWFTDQPKEHVYDNNAGTMMDRNLGATSANPGDVEALGLLYQYGRKDPFVGPSSISNNEVAKTTVEWPSYVAPAFGTYNVEYTVENPMTFIGGDQYQAQYEARWTTSDSPKSMYDPCPFGWRVPDKNIWSNAFSGGNYQFDTKKKGYDFASCVSGESVVWYPVAGGSTFYPNLNDVGLTGCYWSANTTSDGKYGCVLTLKQRGATLSGVDIELFRGQSVRCVKE